jgi:hypothetical protein
MAQDRTQIGGNAGVREAATFSKSLNCKKFYCIAKFLLRRKRGRSTFINVTSLTLHALLGRFLPKLSAAGLSRGFFIWREDYSAA